MFNKLKQFKDLRTRAKTLQNTLANETVEGSAKWGKVKIAFDGNQRATQVTIDNALLGDKTALESGIAEAINDGISKLQKLLASKMKEMGGLDLAKDVQTLMGKE